MLDKLVNKSPIIP